MKATLVVHMQPASFSNTNTGLCATFLGGCFIHMEINESDYKMQSTVTHDAFYSIILCPSCLFDTMTCVQHQKTESGMRLFPEADCC